MVVVNIKDLKYSLLRFFFKLYCIKTIDGYLDGFKMNHVFDHFPTAV